jgi:hypothetical protein
VSRSFHDDEWLDLLERARLAAAEHRRRYPGDPGVGQPLETLYVPADRVTATTTAEFGAEALRLLGEHAPDAASFESAFGVNAAVAERSRARVLAKLERAPVEDLRVDFEDGYGARPDDEEDRHADAAARAVRAARADGTAPPSFGLRVKSFADGAEARSLRSRSRRSRRPSTSRPSPRRSNAWRSGWVWPSARCGSRCRSRRRGR